MFAVGVGCDAYAGGKIHTCSVVRVLLFHTVFVSRLRVVFVVLILSILDELNVFIWIWWLWRLDVFIERLFLVWQTHQSKADSWRCDWRFACCRDSCFRSLVDNSQMLATTYTSTTAPNPNSCGR